MLSRRASPLALVTLLIQACAPATASRDDTGGRDIDSETPSAAGESGSVDSAAADAPPVIRHARVKVVPAAEVRAGPGTRYDIVYRPPHGTVLVIEGDWGDWFRVRLPETSTEPSEGFIHRTAVEVTLIVSPGRESDGEAPPPRD